MKKQGLTVVISHADSTLGQRMTRILARHGAEMILLYQKFDPALRLEMCIRDRHRLNDGCM